MKYSNTRLSKRESEVLLELFSNYVTSKQVDGDSYLSLSGAAKELSTTSSLLDSIRDKLWSAFADTHPEDGPYK